MARARRLIRLLARLALRSDALKRVRINRIGPRDAGRATGRVIRRLFG